VVFVSDLQNEFKRVTDLRPPPEAVAVDGVLARATAFDGVVAQLIEADGAVVRLVAAVLVLVHCFGCGTNVALLGSRATTAGSPIGLRWWWCRASVMARVGGAGRRQCRKSDHFACQVQLISGCDLNHSNDSKCLKKTSN
jgi:hypothetical protein